MRLLDTILSMPGCVALWPCDDHQGSVVDVVGGGGSGTVTGGITYGQASTAPGAGSPALASDATSGNKVEGTGSNLPLGTGSTNWTILAWLFFASAPPNSSGFFGFGTVPSGPTHEARWMIRFNSHIYFWGDASDLDSSTDYDVGRPQLIAASNTNGTVQTSKNGVQVASGTPAAFVTPGAGTWDMFRKPTFGGGIEAAGRISHFAIFNRALTLNQLRYLANVAAGN